MGHFANACSQGMHVVGSSSFRVILSRQSLEARRFMSVVQCQLASSVKLLSLPGASIFLQASGLASW